MLWRHQIVRAVVRWAISQIDEVVLPLCAERSETQDGRIIWVRAAEPPVAVDVVLVAAALSQSRGVSTPKSTPVSQTDSLNVV